MTKSCCFRLDDITACMDWNKFLRLKAIFDKYGVKPLIGVVPDCKDEKLNIMESAETVFYSDSEKKAAEKKCEEFWEIILQLKEAGWDIAQHGYQHLYETKDSGLLGLKNASEFAGLSYERQYEKLLRGQEILRAQGINADIFMAPGHTYDENTLKALRALGFLAVTDGYSDRPYQQEGIAFVPCRSSSVYFSGDFDTICLHTNELTEEEFGEIEKFLSEKTVKILSFSELLSEKLPEKNRVIASEEKRNLEKKKKRDFRASDEGWQHYMQRTWDENKTKKLIKRVFGLPGYLIFKK